MIIDIVNKLVDENMKGDIEMGRKSNKDKDKFNQMDMNVVNQVKEEVLNTMSETAAGFESLDEIVGDEDMVQQHEIELVKEMDTEVDDEKLKQQMRELNMRNMPSLSNLTKMKDEGEGNGCEDDSSGDGVGSDKDKMVKNELNEECSDDAQRKKDELKIKREQNKIKKEFKEREKQLNLKKESNDKSWSFDNISVIMRDGAPYKFNLSLSALQLAEMYSVTNQIYYEESTQRGEKTTKSKGNIPLVNIGHSKKFLKAVLEDSKVDGGTIYLNYAKENPTPLHYDQISNTLSGQFPLYVNDGAHRLESCVMWYKLFKRDMLEVKNPDEYYFSVTILNATIEESENVFVALNSLGLPVSKTRIAFHDTYNLNNAIAKKVMNNSFLRGRIELVSNSLKKTSNCVMTFNTLSKGCSRMSPETPSQVEEAGNFLCSYWDEIVELFPKIYGNVSSETRQIEKANTFIGEVMFIHALFGLAVELQSTEDWKDKLKRLKEPNFLSRNNDLWIRNITRNEGKIINTSKTQDFVKDQLLAKVMG